MGILILATRNEHKVAEIRAILGNGFDYRSLADFPDAPEAAEDANTFAGNATKKVVALARWLSAKEGSRVGQSHNRLVLADDSGLEVDALNGAPGVHSARFAALDMMKPGNSTDGENRLKLLRLLRDIPLEKRTARFRCVLALTPIVDLPWPNSSPVCYGDELEMATQLFEGCCEGTIILEPRGAGGFGYDPLFIPEGYSETFGELPQRVKNKLSHRARALSKLSKHLTGKDC